MSAMEARTLDYQGYRHDLATRLERLAQQARRVLPGQQARWERPARQEPQALRE